jgi:SAM-dependent methyltransferase
MFPFSSSEAKQSKFKVRVRECGRRFIRLFNFKSSRDVEYDFAYRNVFGNESKILDIGGSDSLLPLTLAKRGFKVTVYDFRSYLESHPNLTCVEGDFLENKLPDNLFDYIILISTIEHIGFGSYFAPRYEDGDMKTIAEVKRLLSRNGRAILTFPFTGKHRVIEGFERWYDVDRVGNLFQSMYVLKEEHWVPEIKFFGRWVKWRPGTLIEAQTSIEKYNCQSVACYVVSPHLKDHPETFFNIYDFNE